MQFLQENLQMEVLHQFDPNTSNQQLNFWLATLIAVMAFGGLIYLLKRKAANYNQNMLFAMLLFFTFLIASSTAFFTKWSQLKTGKVKLYPNSIETAYGVVTFGQIKKAYLHDNHQSSFINPNVKRKTIKMLIIEEMNGKVHVLSEVDYDINEIFRLLKKTIEEWKATTPKKE